jgi:hypothetical protein
MSDASISNSNGQHKPLTLGDLVHAAELAKGYIDRANGKLGPDCPIRFELVAIPGPGAAPAASANDALAPRRRPPKARRSRPRSDKITPYQKKRAAMESIALHSLRRDGFTPYFGEKKQYLMAPRDFSLVLACEHSYVAQVIYEVMLHTTGMPGDGKEHRREWAALTFRHFERRGLMDHQNAKMALDYAVDKGYLLRRPRGKRRWTMWEYAVHYRQVDNVPH